MTDTTTVVNAETPNVAPPTVGQQLKAAREAKGWTRGELGRKVGTGYQSIEKIENGVTKHSRYIPLMQACLNLPVDPSMTPNATKNARRARRPRLAPVVPRPTPRPRGPAIQINWENMDPVDIIEMMTEALGVLSLKL